MSVTELEETLSSGSVAVITNQGAAVSVHTGNAVNEIVTVFTSQVVLANLANHHPQGSSL